ncbi:MAG: hypothetical protein ABIP12_07270 [Terriglobales bacterium]
MVASLVTMQLLAACFSPEMTTSQEECCQEMMGDCGQVSMPSSHSCCKYIDSSAPARLEARKPIPTIDLSVELPRMPQHLPGSSLLFAVMPTPAASPPQSLSLSIQILRI